jgi:HEAT repeat protein
VDALAHAWLGQDTPDEVAVAVTRALVEVSDPRGFRVLVDALRHADPRVRQLGAMGLGRLGDSTAVPRLCKALSDAHVGVQRCTAAALGQLRDPMAIKPLLGANEDAVLKALRTNTAFFQKEVAQRLRLKYAAQVKFLADESFDVASHIDKLLADPRVARDIGADGAEA